MAPKFLPGVRNWNTGMSRREIMKFSIRRRDNHALGVTLGRSYVVKKVPFYCLHAVGQRILPKSKAWLLSKYPCHASLWFFAYYPFQNSEKCVTLKPFETEE